MRVSKELEGDATVSFGSEKLLFEYKVPAGDCALFIDSFKGKFYDGAYYKIIHDGAISYLTKFNSQDNDFINLDPTYVVERYMKVYAVNEDGKDEGYPKGCPEDKYMAIVFTGNIVYRQDVERVSKYHKDYWT